MGGVHPAALCELRGRPGKVWTAVWEPRRFDGEPPEELAVALAYLREQSPGPVDVPGLLAHSPAAINAVAAFRRTFAMQTRLAPRVRSILHLVVAAERGTAAGIETATALAAEQGLSAGQVSSYLAGQDGPEPVGALVRLVRRLAGDDVVDEELLAAVRAAGWSARDIVEAVVAAAEALVPLWVLRATVSLDDSQPPT